MYLDWIVQIGSYELYKAAQVSDAWSFLAVDNNADAFGKILVQALPIAISRIMQQQPSGNHDMVGPRQAQGVFAKLLNKEILGEMGRLLFSLLNAFSLSGYHIRLANNLPDSALDKYGRLACSLEHVTLTDEVPSDTSQMIYLFDEEDRTIGSRAWRKKVQVRFDVFSSYWFARPILMPYPVHPVHAGADLRDRLHKYRLAEKKMRIFFSGDREGYSRNRIRYPKAKLPRLDAINAILEEMGDEALLVRGEESLRSICATGYVDKCLIMDQDKFRIDTADWLSTLATGDFFLCPPGFVMPMCHNAVEAMAVGAIPIINYPEWFDPRLEHLENCVEFDDRVDLLGKLNEVLRMDNEQITRMRQRVIEYYDTYLAPESFIRRIESSERERVIVLMITDANVSKNASKLNSRSVLIRGTSAPEIGGWLGRFRH